MNKISLALRSRTTWTIVVLFVINGVSGIRESIPPGWLEPLDALLSILAIYFRASPRAK